MVSWFPELHDRGEQSPTIDAPHPTCHHPRPTTNGPTLTTPTTASLLRSMPIAPLAATLAMQTLATMTLYSIPTVAPEVARDLSVNGTLVGSFVAMAYGVGILSAITSPGLVRRYGGVRASQTVLLAAAAMLTAAALGHGVAGLALSAIVLGLGYGAAATASTHLLVPQTPRPVFNLVMSLRQIGVPLGGVLAALILPPLVLRIGWRGALLTQIVPILALMLVLEIPRRRWDADAEPGRAIFNRTLWQPFAMLADQRIRRLSLAGFVYAGLALCMVAFMTVQLTRTVGLDLVQAGQVLAAYQIAASLSRPVWGWMADRLLTPSQTLSALGIGMAVAAALTGFYGPGWPVWAVTLNAVLAGATSGGYTGVVYAEYAALGGARRTEATGLGTAVMFFGGMAVPPLFGLLVAALGEFRGAYEIGATLALAGGILLILPARARPLLALLCLLPLAGHAASDRGMVVSSQRLAAEAGAEILRQGGNAVDAAVATGYAEAVTNPCCGNIGGGGFLVAHLADGRNVFLNFRETAPAAASRDMYLDADGKPVRDDSIYGWKAVAVPGSVLGLDTALVRYGSMPRAKVMAAAIRLARDGFVLTEPDAEILTAGARVMGRDAEANRIFSGLRAGDRLVQADLAATLQDIADHGPDAFYKGRIPAAVEAASRAGGGVLTAADFAAYRVTEAAPLTCDYRGFQVLSAPPPSSGGVTLCETLNILEGFDLHSLGFGSAAAEHLTIEAFRRVFYDRNTSLGDPAFVTNPLGRLLSKTYAARLRGTIGAGATPSASLGPMMGGAAEKAETTHYSVLDAAGGAVSVTFTINGGFGAGVVAPGTGFLMNDEMDDFTVKPGSPNMFRLIQGEANAIAPGKRPLSSMSPTIVLKDGRVEMVVGSPGGPRIITATTQAILNVLDYGMDARAAVGTPRLHMQYLPDEVFVEPGVLTAETQGALEAGGYVVRVQKPWSAVALIARGRLGGYDGANDPRRPAGAVVVP